MRIRFRNVIDWIAGGCGEAGGGEGSRESIRWGTMDKVERNGKGGEGTRDVTALISSRWRRGPGRKQKAIRHQTFKLENSPAGPLPGTDYRLSARPPFLLCAPTAPR